ncbi:MAG: hypothetical protein VX083_15810 [Pseudomonadota bacterium]|uniref:hypothetical protein n=1 Tax=Thalassovita sp. TaxID=1979401 RepID=UPI002AB21FB0|nr:hypothetical protein [Thalassovita sp.]MEC7961694.1 hypothetical protein [Pseudomonadota bacterium]MEC8040452.1 hypothetical protein [Pseudomonadota bacterium]MEC8294958.1 hypothetical protein [Pseudomonadota bacterium]|tara:strand:- start:1017 stop:1322 length:306 start_codon:yes stop_codon:yes gene_type:complete
MRKFLQQHLGFAGIVGKALTRQAVKQGEWAAQKATQSITRPASRRLSASEAMAKRQELSEKMTHYQTVGEKPRQVETIRKGHVVYYAPSWAKSEPDYLKKN